MTKQAFPKSLAEAIREIKRLQDDVTAANKKAEEANTARSHERANRLRAEEAEKATRENFADLKKRLHNSEMEVARQNGYLERVREDDRVADPLLEIEGQHGKTFVSKRYPAPIVNTRGMDTEFLHDQWNGGREKPKHWTSY